MKVVILVNVGTPQSPEPEDVGVYLNEFLMDENIISVPRPFRDFLVKKIIVPRRKFYSSEKYKKIWTPQGSPLMVESEKLKVKLQSELGPDWRVVLGMQVGKPSLKEAIEGRDEFYFCPLYPQYAKATTGGSLKAIQKKKAKILQPFYAESWFIQSVAAQIKKRLKPQDHLLLSYHGLPAKAENNIYKNQCLETSELLKKELGHQNIITSFQSRLGRSKWIEPYTEIMVKELVAKGVKSLKVACPSFVSDCLETIEEIGLELRKDFQNLGGESFELIPCVNDDDIFVKGLAQKIQKL